MAATTLTQPFSAVLVGPVDVDLTTQANAALLTANVTNIYGPTATGQSLGGNKPANGGGTLTKLLAYHSYTIRSKGTTINWDLPGVTVLYGNAVGFDIGVFAAPAAAQTTFSSKLVSRFQFGAPAAQPIGGATVDISLNGGTYQSYTAFNAAVAALTDAQIAAGTNSYTVRLTQTNNAAATVQMVIS